MPKILQIKANVNRKLGEIFSTCDQVNIKKSIKVIRKWAKVTNQYTEKTCKWPINTGTTPYRN